jgi:hypothetical protein
MTCPACRNHLSSILAAYRDGEDCPSCGLPADAAKEVLAAIKRGADSELADKYADMASRALTAEQQVRELGDRLREIRDAANLPLGDED